MPRAVKWENVRIVCYPLCTTSQPVPALIGLDRFGTVPFSLRPVSDYSTLTILASIHQASLWTLFKKRTNHHVLKHLITQILRRGSINYKLCPLLFDMTL